MGLIDEQRRILSLCFDAVPSEQTLCALGSSEAWLAYREMVRDRLWRELTLALPRTFELVGEAAFGAAFEHQLQHEPPRTRYFREIVCAFVRCALPLWAAKAELHPACADLARYELARWEVRDLESAPKAEVALREFSFERVAVVSRALRLLAVSHAVHLRDAPVGQIACADHYLCVHRASDAERPKVWNLTRTTFALLERLAREDGCASDVVKDLAQASGARIDAAYLDALCATLAQFLEVGIILGSR
jgi:hypothetical protein